MPSDPADFSAPARSDTAPVHGVTAEMMEGAAREAARLADGVAHGTILQGAHPPEPADEPAEAALPEAAAAEAALPEAAAEATGGSARTAEDVAAGARRDADAGRPSPAEALQRYNAKLFSAFQANMAATGAFLTALMGAKSLPEAVQVNVDHTARGLQTLTAQGRELAELAQDLAADALRPFDRSRGG